MSYPPPSLKVSDLLRTLNAFGVNVVSKRGKGERAVFG